MKIYTVFFGPQRKRAQEAIEVWHAANKPNHKLVMFEMDNRHIDDLAPTVQGIHIEAHKERLVIVDEDKIEECWLVVGQDSFQNACELASQNDGAAADCGSTSGELDKCKFLVLAHETADTEVKRIRLVPNGYYGSLTPKKLSGKKVRL